MIQKPNQIRQLFVLPRWDKLDELEASVSEVVSDGRVAQDVLASGLQIEVFVSASVRVVLDGDAVDGLHGLKQKNEIIRGAEWY